MSYLAVEDVGRCELTCRTLQNHANHVWDTLVFKNNPTLRPPSADSSTRIAVVHYKVASTLAKRIGDMKYSISKHTVVYHDNPNPDFSTTTEARIDDDCEGCDFPNLNLDPFKEETCDDYDLFVRFCRTSDNKLLAEGFCPHDNLGNGDDDYGSDFSGYDHDTVTIKIRNLDYSRWPQFSEITRSLIKTTSEGKPVDNARNKARLGVCMRDLTVVVIGVHKDTSKASVAIAQSNFAKEIFDWRNACRPLGCMSAKSHGPAVDTKLIIGEMSARYENRLCDARLGMIWDSHTYSHFQKIPKKDCNWTLTCECSYLGRKHSSSDDSSSSSSDSS